MSLDKFKIESKSKEFFEHFDSEAKLDIVLEENSCLVNVETEISGLLIGRHGETLEALQHILRLLVSSDTEEFVPLVLDISGYRAIRQKELEDIAKELAEKVKQTGQKEIMPQMSPYERRTIHLILSEIEDIISESEGEEPYRRVVIKKTS